MVEVMGEDTNEQAPQKDWNKAFGSMAFIGGAFFLQITFVVVVYYFKTR